MEKSEIWSKSTKMSLVFLVYFLPVLPISFVLVQVLQHLRAVKELVLVGVHGVEVPPQLLCIGHPMAVVMTLVITLQGTK